MRSSSHATILKSTTLIGGASVITLVFRMIRTKALAVLLGPTGVGLESMYNSIILLSQTITDLGVNTSGVRQVAAAVGSGDQRVIGRTIWVLRRLSLVLGVFGALLLFAFRKPIAVLTFGSEANTAAVGWLSVILLFAAVNGGQGALLQGMRRIGDLAKMQIIGAICGTLFSIPIVYKWGQQGIPAYLVMVAGVTVLMSWFYARKVKIAKPPVPLREMRLEARALIRLGLVFMSTSAMSLAALYTLRVLISRTMGLEATGLFQAATGLSMVYFGFVIQALGTDFYPRLTAVAADNSECNRMVNEQAEISLLLTIPGIVTMIGMAPWIIHLFYSPKFAPATEVLVWQTAGVLLQVAAYPMGFILVAKGLGRIFFITETLNWSAYLLLALVGIRWFGLPGVGIAFLAMYAFCGLMLYFIVRRVSGFRWSAGNRTLILLGVVLAVVSLLSHFLLPGWGSGLAGGILALFAGTFCFGRLLRLVGSEKINQYFKKLKIPIEVPRWMSRCCGDVPSP